MVWDDEFICYLPDEKKLWLKKQNPNVEFRVIPQDDRYREIVGKFSIPAPEKLQEFAWALHGRNLNIIMGDDLATPVDAVYYSAPLDKQGNPDRRTAKGGNTLSSVVSFVTTMRLKDICGLRACAYYDHVAFNQRSLLCKLPV
ncbi:hypothetical protein N5V81_13620 [Escherichia coli]|nr:hypothetical protein [Escherichia coli]